MIFLLIEEDKVWFGRYLVGLAGSRLRFFVGFFFFSLFLQFKFCKTDSTNCFLIDP